MSQGSPPFRLIAIVADERGLDDLFELAREYPGMMFGAMLRDPEHRAPAVLALGDAALRRDLPRNVTLISNGVVAPGIGWLHITSAGLLRMRELMPDARVGVPFGASVHSVAEALLAAQCGASYIIASPIFPTSSKPGHPGIGLDGLRAIRDAVTLPVFALGGIDGGNALACLNAGAHGIAAISFFSPSMRADLRRFLDDASPALSSSHDLPSPRSMPVVLSIAGSDSGGGAGVQGDLKTFEAHGVFGTTAITAITAQNTLGVRSVHPLPAAVVRGQMEAVFDDFDVAAVKIGMLADGAIALAVADVLGSRGSDIPIVLDPVMVSTSGHALLAPEAVEIVAARLIPLATLVTPNVREAGLLSGIEISSTADMLSAAAAIRQGGARAVLVTGGDLPILTSGIRRSIDLFDDGAVHESFAADFIESRHTHGTGCALSSAIAANLANGLPLIESIRRAKEYVAAAILDAPGLGRGHGPILHRRPPPSRHPDPQASVLNMSEGKDLDNTPIA